MKQQPDKRKLVLVAVGLLAATGTATVTSTAQAGGETCQLEAPNEQPGGEVGMALYELKNAEQIDEDLWTLFVDPKRLAGVDVPEGLEHVEVHLTGEQLELAMEVSSSANSQIAVFAVHSEKWVQEVEERLLGGFSVNFKASVCEYSQPWS